MNCDEGERNVNSVNLDDEILETVELVGDGYIGATEDDTGLEIREDVPKVGMKFNDENEVFEFYKRHAFSVGFPVRKRSSRKGGDGVKRYATFTCAREGRRNDASSSSLKPQPSMHTGCLARLTAMCEIEGMWVLTKVILEHNHATSPSKSRLYRCNRQMSDQVKRRLELNDIAGIPMHKSYNSTVIEAGGYEQMRYIEKDCRNYIDRVRRLRLGEGDAAPIQAYFSKMQANCPGFYFNVDLDDECRLRNVFWCDNRCREAYKEFGDVVTFDTTYLTNKYDMPFAPFVGVNHHGQSMLLGCGLLSNEDTETFVWIFRTWLQCMEGKAPLGIITDQDRAMQNSIGIVFPNSRYRWCLWHILKKLPEKFGYHSEKGRILRAVHNVVYDSQTPEQFNGDWNSMIDRYELNGNDWLAGLYMERARWVPCYLKSNFWAGMSTTQRSESMNAFFDGYVHSKTSLKQFVEQYELALRSKVEKEFQADFKSYSQMVPCVTKFHMEKQFQSVYTIAKFKEFQAEITGIMYCRVIAFQTDYIGARFSVEEEVFFEDGEKKVVFLVSFDRESCEIACSCHLFEFRGILCRHAITVLRQNGVTSLPDKYIIRRWRRDVHRHYMRVKINYNGWISTPQQLRYEQLCQTFGNVADIASENEARTRELLEWLETQMSDMNLSNSGPSQDISSVAPQCGGSEKESGGNMLDPKCSKRKGAPRKLCKKSPLESSSTKSKASSRKKKGATNEDGELHGVQQFPAVMSQSFSHLAPVTCEGFSGQLMLSSQPYMMTSGPHFPTNQQLMSLYSQQTGRGENEVTRSNCH